MKNYLLSLLCCGAFCANLLSQESCNSSGGDINNSFGKVSYSVGQVFYTVEENNNLSINQGVQQAWSKHYNDLIYLSEDMKIQIYPNPVLDKLIVDLSNANNKFSSYTVYDSKGKEIKYGPIKAAVSTIDFSDLSRGNYFLKIITEDFNFQTVSIIKN